MRTRCKSDPRIVEILAAFDRSASGPFNDNQTLGTWMGRVVDTDCERFDADGWTADGIRCVLVAFLMHAPDDALDEMLDTARVELAELPGMEAERAADLLLEAEYNARRAAEAN